MSEAGNVIPFPKAIKRGRKRVSRYVHTAGGDLALLLRARDGDLPPDNVERLQLVRDRWKYENRHSTMAMALATAIFTALDEGQRTSVRRQLRLAAYDGRAPGDLRLAASELLECWTSGA